MGTLVAPSPQSRSRALYRRWAHRWDTPAADSFARVASFGLGSTDTGHDWSEFQSGGTGPLWVVRDGAARLNADDAGQVHVANLYTAKSDVNVKARVTIGAVTGATHGTAVTFRGIRGGGVYWAFAFVGGSSWALQRVDPGAGYAVTILASTLTGPALAAGSTYEFWARATGTTIEGYLDGALVLSGSSAVNQTETMHGMQVRQYADHRFQSWKCLRI